jgi:hypothetical protein
MHINVCGYLKEIACAGGAQRMLEYPVCFNRSVQLIYNFIHYRQQIVVFMGIVKVLSILHSVQSAIFSRPC